MNAIIELILQAFSSVAEYFFPTTKRSLVILITALVILAVFLVALEFVIR